LKHFASPRFWRCYRRLPQAIRNLADKNFKLLKSDPQRPALRLKQIGDLWSVRVGLGYRALGASCESGINWFWIGSHADYDKLLKRD
jgi:hypothetical protein